jgi:GT2 family glycosyltransferase
MQNVLISVSFVIPIYNHPVESRVMLYSLLESLPKDLGYEVILVDDASGEETRSWLASLSLPHVRVLFNEHNLGFAKASNRGAAAVKGEYLCLVNNDLEFDAGWLLPMLAVLQKPELKAGVVGNVQYRVADGYLDHAGVLLSEGGAFVHFQPKLVPNQPFAKVVAVTGACLLMRRSVFEQLGGLEERYLNGCEDIDLCYKVRQQGLNVWVAYDSKIRHHVSLSRKPLSRQNECNSQLLFSKWRKEIKQDLAGVWLPLLQAKGGWDESVLPGKLSESFLASPYAASRVIAESTLCRLEAYWQRVLADVHSDAETPLEISSQGLKLVAGSTYYSVADEINIEVVGLHSARNFYFCGFKANPDEARLIQVTIEVNGIQTVVHRLGAERELNVGIINPLWLPTLPARFKVRFDFVDDTGCVLSGAGSAVYLTHVVVDDLVLLNRQNE